MSEQNLTLALLSQRTGIPSRKLRYVIDHELAPERTWSLSEETAGQPRVFDVQTGVFLATSAYLLEAGCRRETVREIMENILSIQDPRNVGRPLVLAAIHRDSECLLEIGDALYVRWNAGRIMKTGWHMRTGKGPRFSELRPKIVISVDIAAIRDLVKGKAAAT